MPPFFRFGMVLIVSGNAGVDVPAEVIEAGGIDETANFLGRFVFEMAEADDDIGHLDAGVIDVILHFDVAGPSARIIRTKVSPRIALRRWPMCAALLGLILVCSTMILRRELRGARGVGE